MYKVIKKSELGVEFKPGRITIIKNKQEGEQDSASIISISVDEFTLINEQLLHFINGGENGKD